MGSAGGACKQVNVGLLFSGGLDSTALAWWHRPEIAFTIDYGQVCAQGEIRAASTVCKIIGIQHEVITADCGSLGSGDLAGRAPAEIAPASEWWPFRNQLLITLGAMRGVNLGLSSLIVGSVLSDGFHRDGTREFYELVDKLTAVQEGSLRIEAPAIELTSAQLLVKSKVPRSVASWAHSCHCEEFACGTCRGCAKNLMVTQEVWGE